MTGWFLLSIGPQIIQINALQQLTRDALSLPPHQFLHFSQLIDKAQILRLQHLVRRLEFFFLMLFIQIQVSQLQHYTFECISLIVKIQQTVFMLTLQSWLLKEKNK